MRAFHAVVPELLAEFRAAGPRDPARGGHPLRGPARAPGGLRWTRSAVQVACHELAHAYADGRWVALGGGGYAVVDVVPRSWTHLVGIAGGREIAPETVIPEGWRQQVFARTRQLGPVRDDRWAWPVAYREWEAGYDPADRARPGDPRDPQGGFPVAGVAALGRAAAGALDGVGVTPTVGCFCFGGWAAAMRQHFKRVLSTGALRAHLLAPGLPGRGDLREGESAQLPAVRGPGPARARAASGSTPSGPGGSGTRSR